MIVRTLAAALVLLASLAACSTVPLANDAKRGTFAAATLASSGTYEMELAPLYTALAVARHNTARALDAGRISVDAARAVQSMADAARADVDLARAGFERGAQAEAAVALARARTTLIGIGAQLALGRRNP